ncbi:MAG: 50S ribosomal protein L9 [Phycisphaerae bacterium]|nr:50S ribosomal protein L9 [Phycisphaerae bacterium]
MKVLLRRNVPRLGRIGQVVDVRAGYARNYLLPQRLAVEPTAGNVKVVEAEKERYLQELAAMRSELEAKAQSIRGKEVTIAGRANEEGRLYGSVGPAQIVAALAEQGIFIELENIVLDSPIRQLDKYDVELLFGEDIKSMIHVWVVPVRDEGEQPSAESPGLADSTEPAAE